MEIKNLTFILLILVSFIIYTNASNTDCVYTIYVQTGDIASSGTKSNISLFLSDDTKAALPITNLKDWALPGSASDQFAPGKLDIFAGKGPCLSGAVCSLIIILDGFDDWYCDFIEVTTVGLIESCTQKNFMVKKWLDSNKGSAVILRDECPSSDDGAPSGSWAGEPELF